MTSRHSLNSTPHVVEITGTMDAETAFRRLAFRQRCVFLDSARQTPGLGRYSYLAAEPFAFFAEADGDRGMARLAEQLDRCAGEAVEDLPPFQGGAIGLWSYGFSQTLERIANCRYNEFPLPPLTVGLYDVVIAFDHERDRAWIISHGFPETDPNRRRQWARARADACQQWLAQTLPPPQSVESALCEHDLAPHYRTSTPDVWSNFSAEDYRRCVLRAIDYIHAGDVFQVNLAQRMLCRATTDSVSLYLKMRQLNAAPFACYFDMGPHQIVSASPERFLRIQGHEVEARPIKGTRQRTTLPEADLFSGAELRASPKDLAENVMIVDLMRNDLSRVCEDNSIRVTQLCGLESYEFVQHLVSVVRGRLREQVLPLDVVRAAFPGGSITGAPKVRAMEIIAELEPTARNAYCGSLGYIGFSGNMDLNILIRTVTASRGWWQFPVGGGIVGQSDPDQEYLETLVKAEGMLRAVRACRESMAG